MRESSTDPSSLEQSRGFHTVESLAVPKVMQNELHNQKQSILSLPSWCAVPAPAGSSFVRIALSPRHSATGHPIRQVSKEVLDIANRITAEQVKIQFQHGLSGIQFFRPSQAALQKNGIVLVDPRQRPRSITTPNAATMSSAVTKPSAATKLDGLEKKSSMGYDATPEENCSVFVQDIPAGATYADFLSTVRGGKVYICRMDPPNDEFPTQAAKLVFFNRAAATTYLRQTTHGGIYVLGKLVRASWNRVRYGPHPHPEQSRVIIISGPEDLMSFDYFEQFFSERFEYDLQARFEIPYNLPKKKAHVWQFACLRAQAESARLAIEREFGGIFKVQWAHDPCDLPWKL